MAASEEEFLLVAARPVMDGGARARLRGFAEAGIDWNRLVGIAGEHAMLPTLYTTIKRECADLTPGSIMANLQRDFVANTHHNLALTAELNRVCGLLADARIGVIAFKGPILAITAYGDLAMRQFTDIDVIVRRGDIDIAAEGLMDDGYRFAHAGTRAATDLMLSATNHAELINSQRHSRLELHWAFAPPFFRMRLEDAGIWDRLTSVSAAGVPLPALAPEDSVLAMCLHGAKHRWARLEWITCLAVFVARNPVDWNRVDRVAGAIGLRRVVALGRALVEDLTGTEIGAPSATDDNVLRLVRITRKSLFQPGHTVISDVPLTRFHLLARERLRDRVRSAFLVLTTPTEEDVIRIHLPRGLRFLYRLKRLATVLIRDPRRNWRLATRGEGQSS